MPYITDSAYRTVLRPSSALSASTPGELNFQITTLLTQYIKSKGLDYQAINDVLGALEGAKLEFYRRVAVPYEDQKIQQNGDVY